jgi:hypothetical protein
MAPTRVTRDGATRLTQQREQFGHVWDVIPTRHTGSTV